MRPAPPSADGYSPRRLRLLAAFLVLLVLGARWAVVNRYTPSLPFMDEWDAEGLAVFQPWFQHDHSLANFFVLQNEHRVALTRVLTLGLTVLNRQWDQRLEAVANALLPAALAAAFCLAAGRQFSRRAAAALLALLAVAYATPLAWENLIHGFHSQQFFLIDLALGAIALIPFNPVGSGRWWLGCLCMALSLGSMGSGLVAAAICAALALLPAIRRRSFAGLRWPTLVACGLVLLAGVALRHVVAADANLQAASFSDYWLTLTKSLGWPAFDYDWGYTSLLLWAPWTLIVLRALRRDAIAEPWTDFLAGLGGWVLLQFLATAYARGAGGGSPAPRYIDTVLVGLIANALALATLLRGRRWPATPRGLKLLTASWIAVCLLGLAAQEWGLVPAQMADIPRSNAAGEAEVRDYLATGNVVDLQQMDVPYPSWQRLRDILNVPVLRTRLPASVRTPLTLLPEGRRQDADPFKRWHFLAAGTWRSHPAQAEVAGWLGFDLSGNAFDPQRSLVLRDAADNRIEARILPAGRPAGGTATAWVRAPRNPFVVEAASLGGRGGFAFSDPVEMGTGSRWAERACRYGGIIAALGGLGLLTAAFWPGGGRTRISPAPAST